MSGEPGLTISQAMLKRGFDVLGAATALTLTWWVIAIAWLAATLDTRMNGFIFQERVGRHARLFRVVKIRTMRPDLAVRGTITIRGDPRITRLGAFLRRTKIDELPQLWNVLVGDMSIVGPRPDVPGYADRLSGDARFLLSVRPGITGPATLKYRHEEWILAKQIDPQAYNDEVIYPDKVRINLEYIRRWRFRDDLRYIWQTIFN